MKTEKLCTHFTAEDETKQHGHCQLRVREKYHVEEIRICWRLKKQPANRIKIGIHILVFFALSCNKKFNILS